MAADARARRLRPARPARAAGDSPSPATERGAAAARELDRLIHERVRLGIVSALASAPVLTFAELKRLLEVSDGNLSVHARKLEEAGYVACEKSFAGRTPKTEYRLTAAGRRALASYLDHMSALIRAARSS
jgi:DNA-binding HxlR family transcriptional regulator